jgi:hypothetical protein
MVRSFPTNGNTFFPAFRYFRPSVLSLYSHAFFKSFAPFSPFSPPPSSCDPCAL